MKFNFFALFLILSTLFVVPARATDTFSDCGPGWVMADNGKLEGVTSVKCEKLWCRDLENGKSMGSGNTAASGYVATTNPVLLEAAGGKSIECFGERKWCAGDTPGRWNPEYGAYTKRGEDSAQFVSTQRGDCFSWGAGTPSNASCANGQIPVLVNGKWGCSSQKTGSSINVGQKSVNQGSSRRGATLKKM